MMEKHMNSKPVGIFDSGFGGLTALSEFRKLMPDENIIFLGDNGHAPYGGRTKQELHRLAGQNVDFLYSFGVKAILAACGTVSINAPNVLENAPVRTFNVLRPAVEYIQRLEDAAPLGIIATEASIRSGGFEKALREAGVKRKIISVPCPELVPLIEAGADSADPKVLEAVAGYLTPLKEAKISALLLGCTHYGIIEPVIRAFMGENVDIISAAKLGAAALAEYLSENQLTGGTGRTSFFTSGEPEQFRETASEILGYEPAEVLPVTFSE